MRLFGRAATLAALVIGILADPTLSSPVSAQQRPDFKGRTVTVLVSFVPGGAYDSYGRILARHIGNYLPGRPNVVTQNMPGAGGLIGANYLYNVAPRDGSMIGVISQTAPLSQLLDSTPGVKYDAQKFAWIGRLDTNIEVEFTWHASAIRTLEDAKKRDVLVAGTGPTSNSVIFPRLMNAMLGTRFKVVTGYDGVQAASMALERGEIDGMNRIWSAVRTASAEWLRDKKIDLLVQYSVSPHPDLPNVPTIVDWALNPEQRQIFAIYASVGEVGSSIVAPPGLPAETVAALRDGFLQAVRAPDFLKDAREARLELDPLAGDKLQRLVEQTFAIPTPLVAKAKELGGF